MNRSSVAAVAILVIATLVIAAAVFVVLIGAVT